MYNGNTPFQATGGSNTQFSYNYNSGPNGTWNNYQCPPGYSQYNQPQWAGGQPGQSWNNSGVWSAPNAGQQAQQVPQQAGQPQQQNQQKGCDNYQRTFDYVQQCQNWTNAQ